MVLNRLGKIVERLHMRSIPHAQVCINDKGLAALDNCTWLGVLSYT